MANNKNKSQAGTDIQKVRQQNQQSNQGQNAEFAAETNAAEVRQQNQQSQAKKGQQQQ
ncbi:gamma-type small acid-soluble spore protein [Bacillus horti]|uniref:Small, acid-soluble spore protein gamma-type n=1 Tax=Caldalkalibacillus horti TaxID=77523 RepID=A0ABT9W1D9_9BACI|nr:gamma-type small acid-soluble spore protein [Bacillus horti]MDQ0167065.1 small acid-soluble spore protein E (minor gamma-type SASP) [Bacillus horti]